ncbi:MAG TPA: hypothetical protein VN328_04575, partial [Thermodesulfovibrionales bacterium]|nr:hypothetical protein [Thermodesulfovibrionales bacterium]
MPNTLSRISFMMFLIALFNFSATSHLCAADDDYVEYVNVLSRLDKANPNSILLAKDDLLSKFNNSTDENMNEAFRAFWNFYNQAIREIDKGFSSNGDYQKVLSEISDATGLYHDPFPAFEKLDNAVTQRMKNQYAKILNELAVYRKAGMNFGSSEGGWYLKDDLDFLLAASVITKGGYKDYVRFYSEEWRKVIVNDGGLMISWDELRKRIIRWEQFGNEHTQLPETENDIRPKISWMVDVYLTGIDNSRILKAENMLNEEVKNSYEAFLKEGTTSAHFEAVKGAFDIWNKNQFKLSKELVDYLKEKGHARFIYLLEQSLRTAGDRKSQDT